MLVLLNSLLQQYCRYLFGFCLVCWGIIGSMHVQAVDDLYTVQVPIYQNTPTALEDAKVVAFAEVISQLTGQKRSWNNAHIQSSKGNIDAYFDNISQVVVPGEALPYLRLKFNTQAISTLLEAAGLPIWDGLRPKFMVWLTKRDFTDSNIIDVTESTDSAVLMAAAKSRGLSLVFPIMDIEDTLNIEALDIDAQQLDTIRQASNRYQADIILYGTIIKQSTSKLWLQGQILMPQTVKAWQASAFDIDVLADVAMENLGEQLTKIYARQPTNLQTQNLLLQVNGIDSVRKYAQVQDRLQQLSRIMDVQVYQVKQNSLTLLISHEGSHEHILAGIDLIKQMQRVAPLASRLVTKDINTAPAATDGIDQQERFSAALNLALQEQQLIADSSLSSLDRAQLAVYQWL